MSALLLSFDQKVRPAIEEYLLKVVDSQTLKEYPGLADMLMYHMGWKGAAAGIEAQGKRIRPLLVTLTCEAVGGDWQTALPAAAAVEILHNFSLIHDDIEDQGILRRGRRTLWKMWGVPLAINAGDTMFTLAFQALGNLQKTCGDQVVLQAYNILIDTNLKLTGGQHLDISNEQVDKINLVDYWKMISGKTAALLSACTRLGALVGGADGDLVEKFGRFGYNLGLSFQAKDDWLGLWGDEKSTGKSTKSDLLTKKKTLPVVYALEQNLEFAHRWQQAPAFTLDELPELTQLLADEGAQKYSEKMADQLMREALEALNSTGCENNALDLLREMAMRLGNRIN